MHILTKENWAPRWCLYFWPCICKWIFKNGTKHDIVLKFAQNLESIKNFNFALKCTKMLNIAKQEIDQTDLHLRYFTIEPQSLNIVTQLSTRNVACCLQITKVHYSYYRSIPSPATSHVLYLFNAESFDTCLAKNWDNLEVSNDLFLLSDPDCPGSLEIQSYAILFTVSTQLLPNFTLCRVLDLGLVKWRILRCYRWPRI